jgi:hypothetical protein
MTNKRKSLSQKNSTSATIYENEMIESKRGKKNYYLQPGQGKKNAKQQL